MSWKTERRKAFTKRVDGRVGRREKRPVPRWATEVRVIPAGSSVVSNGYDINYSHDLMPHCIEPMEAADDPMIRKIVLWFGIREGKTNAVCMNIIGRTITDDPGNIYSVHPTDDDAKKFSNDDVEPTIEACLSDYFVERKSRDSGRTVGYKRFRAGSLRIISAGSINAFRGTSVKVLNLHELDALDPESIYKAFGRTTGFGDAIIILESTCTLAPTYDQQGRMVYHSNIHEAFDQGDKRKWFCRCGSVGNCKRSSSIRLRSSRRNQGRCISTSARGATRITTRSSGGKWRRAGFGIRPPVFRKKTFWISEPPTRKLEPSIRPCAAIGATGSIPFCRWRRDTGRSSTNLSASRNPCGERWRGARPGRMKSARTFGIQRPTGKRRHRGNQFSIGERITGS
jgi:phage terminase large subunit GpA-like protein